MSHLDKRREVELASVVSRGAVSELVSLLAPIAAHVTNVSTLQAARNDDISIIDKSIIKSQVCSLETRLARRAQIVQCTTLL